MDNSFSGPVMLTGIVLFSSPVNDYDRRVVLLTKERGKITAFAKGARRQGSRLLAATDQFCFGQFKMFEGRTAYNLIEASISNYFENLREDFEGACLGMYFLEFADYYTRENNDEIMMLGLLYQSLRALGAASLNKRLVRYIYEIKATVVNGEFPGVRQDKDYSPDARYAVDYIVNSDIEKLYTFTLSDSVLKEVGEIAEDTFKRIVGVKFKSLEMLSVLE